MIITTLSTVGMSEVLPKDFGLLLLLFLLDKVKLRLKRSLKKLS